MTKAEKLCENIKPNMRDKAVTLVNAITAMQDKIDKEISGFAKMPLAQQVTVGTGEKMLRANPAMQEFRAMVKDYAQMLNQLQEMLDESGAPAEIKSLDSIRSKFKVV